MANHKINYPELGTVDKLKLIYGEGDSMLHPSGWTYILRKGIWVVRPHKRVKYPERQVK